MAAASHADAASTGVRRGDPDFPRRMPQYEPLFEVRPADASVLKYGDSVDDTTPRTHVVRKQCPSTNSQPCSGHGNCTRSAARGTRMSSSITTSAASSASNHRK